MPQILFVPIFAAGRQPASYVPLCFVDIKDMLDLNVELRV
jgi:hypothetical protein